MQLSRSLLVCMETVWALCGHRHLLGVIELQNCLVRHGYGFLIASELYFSGQRCPLLGPGNDMKKLFSGLLPENPVRAPGALTEIKFYRTIAGVW